MHDKIFLNFLPTFFVQNLESPVWPGSRLPAGRMVMPFGFIPLRHLGKATSFFYSVLISCNLGFLFLYLAFLLVLTVKTIFLVTVNFDFIILCCN